MSSDLSEERFSGVFDAGDPDSLISFLEHSAAVKVDRLKEGRVTLSPAE
jgi:ferric-dicitrate binding protein FerR (iron transport regulator)